MGIEDIDRLKGNETPEDRIERYRAENDRIWGRGNWVMCDTCEDGDGKPAFHHKEFHK